MPGVFIGSTELTTVGDIKIGGTDVQEVYVGATKVFPSGAPGDPSITFTWDPENDEALPGGTTFTRAGVKQEFDGTDVTELASGAIPENSAAVGGGAQGFHPEPAATNNCTNSNQFDAAAWAQIGMASRTDQGTNALGLEEYLLTLTTNNERHDIFDSNVQAESVYFIVSQPVTNPITFTTVRHGSVNVTDFSAFNISTKVVTENGSNSTGRIIDLGSGFCRSEITTSSQNSFTMLGTSATGTPGQNDPTFVGASEGLLVCQGQAEDTSYSTSPVITLGSIGTRPADVLDVGVAVTTAFSALLDLTLPDTIGTSNTITLLGPDSTAIDILSVDDAFNIIMDDGGTPITIGTSSAGARIKVAYGRDGGDRSASLDGATAVDGDAPGAGHEGENFQLGSRASVNQSRCIHHLSTLFNVKKSDAELEALAS